MVDLGISDRVLPHNLDAEKAVLGAILLENSHIDHAIELLKPTDFFRSAHLIIFKGMIRLTQSRTAIDFVTLKDELLRTAELEMAGGPAYVASLVDGVPRSSNVVHYAKIVKEKSLLRQLIAAAKIILSEAYEAEQDVSTIVDQAERHIFAIAEDRVGSGFVSLRDIAMGAMPAIESAIAQKQLITGVPTGFTDLDEMTSGFQNGDLIIIAARPSMGKTSLALNIAQHVGTKTERTVAICSLEMSKEQLFIRMLTAEANIDAHRLRTGHIGDRDWQRLSTALGALADSSIYIDDSPGMGVLEMRAKCRRLKAEHGLHLLIIDYIQLMQASGRVENRNLELASISRGMKALAKELEVPIVVISQLSRAPEARSDHRPQLSDLRESGALEQDADVVMMIYRAEQYADAPAEEQGTAEIIVAKQRNGPTGVVRLAFLKQQTRFANLDMTRS